MRRLLLRALMWGITICIASLAEGANETLDARGFHPQREPFSQLPFEHIDPLTGNVLLTFTDLVLPGDAGFDLRIQRTYNSKIFVNHETESFGADSWAGLGWTFHMGRVQFASSLYTANPIIEMPDGSGHVAFPHIAPLSGCTMCFITREYWVYDRNTRTLRLPNGVRYTFGWEPVGSTAAYVTLIEDPFGNQISITYATGQGAEAETIATITQTVGTDTRVVTFGHSTDALAKLTTMTFQGRQWTYNHVTTTMFGYTLLSSVQPPIGPAWQFTYNTSTLPRYELTRVTTPNGGWINYTHNTVPYYVGLSSAGSTRSMTQRVTGGRDVPPGTWTLAYSQGSAHDQTLITTPCNTFRYTFYGFGTFAPQNPRWRLGLPASVATVSGGITLQTEITSWVASSRISDQPDGQDVDTFVPLLQQRSITRDSVTVATNHSYANTNFNDYGRPNQSIESGQLSRTTSWTFQYGFSPYIVDKVSSETVNVAGESFSKAYNYRTSDGFLLSQTVYGVTTTFTSTTRGNIASRTNARGFETSMPSYRYGQWTTQNTPEYAVTRTINPDGTVASETRRGFTTVFDYDSLSRLTLVDPSLGNSTVTTYDTSGGTFVRRARGSSQTTSTLDGFGRLVSSENSVGIKTDTDFDSCGRQTYQSYLHTTNNIGTTIAYDGLWRVVRRTHPDGQFIAFDYSGTDLTITDENGRTTLHTRRAFGDPDELRLVSVRDAAQAVTQYTYNAVGSLRTVTHPNNTVRTLTYNTKNQLVSEAHLENGTTTYTRDAVGNMSGRTDAENQFSAYAYDGNNRLRTINHPGTLHDVTMNYDASDNKTSLSNGFITSTFGFDAANRLTSRADATGGRSFETVYTYDGNDNVNTMEYPSGRVVDYDYDAENRVIKVTNGGTTIYADTFSFHPSGAIASYRAGNQLVHTQTFDSRYRPDVLNAGGVLGLNYNYDDVGNVTGVDDTRSGMDQTFAYDNRDRLQSVSGWNAAAFTYDSVGNRLSRTVYNPTSFNYNVTTNRLTSSSGGQSETFAYDFNGNITSDGTTTYLYTPDNLTASATTAGITTTYRYDGDNLRIQKLLAGMTAFYIHGTSNVLLSEFQQACAQIQPIRDYIYLGTRLLASIRFPGLGTTVSLTSTASQRAETGPASVVGVRITTATGDPVSCSVSVPYSTSAITAAEGTDYSAASGTLVFAAGTISGTVQNVTVPVLTDALDEPDETFSVNLAQVTAAELLLPAVHTITILDDDAQPNITITDGSAVEGNQTIQLGVTVNLSAPSGRNVTVNYTTANLSAVSGHDYVSTSGLITFVAGDVSEPLNVSIVGDLQVENVETFAVNLSNATFGTVTDSQGIGTILGDDVFSHDPIQAGVTTVSSGHITELRLNINDLRTSYGIGPFTWTDSPLPAGTTVLGMHITEMRTALGEVYSAAKITPPAYTDATLQAGITTIRAAHIQELRNAIRFVP